MGTTGKEGVLFMNRKDVLLVNPHNNPEQLKVERELKGYNTVDEQQLPNGTVKI